MALALRESSNPPFLRRPLVLIALMLAGGMGFAVPAASQAHGDYTSTQAMHGARVFSNHCAACHGAELQGQTGPALAGSSFGGLLQYSKMSSSQLFEFISTQMPKDAPGSLSTQQYLDVLAFILSKNGYPAGDDALSRSSLDQVKLLPYPGASKPP
jgi:mono/diheme cytochrome c family protein